MLLPPSPIVVNNCLFVLLARDEELLADPGVLTVANAGVVDVDLKRLKTVHSSVLTCFHHWPFTVRLKYCNECNLHHILKCGAIPLSFFF